MIEPFLKWAGGKRWLVKKYQHLFPSHFNRYIEPFLGSGAVFFSLRPARALLSDRNTDLIDTYRAIKNDWRKVFTSLKIHHKNHNSDYYYEVRGSNPKSLYSRAARLIYLNRTCWNGLYRVNLKGNFNVPIGTKSNVILESDDFEKISNLLKSVELISDDFEKIIDRTRGGDFLFVDPPYTIMHNNNGFIKYNDKLFKWSDQIRLSECLINAKGRGVKIILTNADNHSIRNLYKNNFRLVPITRHSVLAADSSCRRQCTELIISSH